MRGVIIVDDSWLDRYLVRRTLEELGVSEHVVELKGGRELVELVSNGDRLRAECGDPSAPILVLLDINMPGLSGFETIRELEELAAAGSIDPGAFEITMFTSSAAPSDREEAARYWIVKDYVVKPVMPDQLFDVLAERCAP